MRFWRAVMQPAIKSKNASWSPPLFTNGRRPPEDGSEHWLSRWKTATGFKMHFPRAWPLSHSTGMGKVTGSSNWVNGTDPHKFETVFISGRVKYQDLQKLL